MFYKKSSDSVCLYSFWMRIIWMKMSLWGRRQGGSLIKYLPSHGNSIKYSLCIDKTQPLILGIYILILNKIKRRIEFKGMEAYSGPVTSAFFRMQRICDIKRVPVNILSPGCIRVVNLDGTDIKKEILCMRNIQVSWLLIEKKNWDKFTVWLFVLILTYRYKCKLVIGQVLTNADVHCVHSILQQWLYNKAEGKLVQLYNSSTLWCGPE